MPTAGAASEVVLGSQNERRHPPLDLLSSSVGELSVAFDAALEERPSRVDREGANDLSQLIAEAVALDQEESGQPRPTGESPVTGQHDAVLAPSRRDETLSGEVRTIEDIAPEDAKPPRQAAKGLVDDEPLRRLHGHEQRS